MSSPRHFDRILRWYPKSWRARYGEGLSALVEDTYRDGAMTRRHRRTLIVAGLKERARVAGFAPGASSTNERLRIGSQLVLSGWVLFMVAGAVFAKFSEHFATAMPLAHRSLANASFDAVRWTGALGMLVVSLSALMVLPLLRRHFRHGGWRGVQRPLVRSGVALGVAAALLLITALRAHSLSAHQRNAGFTPYGALVLVSAAALVLALVIGLSSAISISRHLSFSRQMLTTLSRTAIGLTGMMVVIVVGVLTWWVNEALHAPHFLVNGLGSGLPFTSNVFPPTLVFATALMMLGLGLGVVGVARVIEGLRGEHDILVP